MLVSMFLALVSSANKQVISNPMTTVQTLNDSGKMNYRTILAKPFGYPSQKQKSCKASAICSTFAFVPPHQDRYI